MKYILIYVYTHSYICIYMYVCMCVCIHMVLIGLDYRLWSGSSEIGCLMIQKTRI